MGRTPDRTPGPAEEEELQLDDRTSDGDPTVTGALRRIGDYLRFRTASAVEQILSLRGYPSGFNGIDLTGVNDGDSMVYELSTKTIKPTAISGGTIDRAWRRHFLLMGG